MDNNVSFKANIVTNMKGRHDIIKPVKRLFAQRTAKLPGELHIFKESMYPDAIVLSLNKEKDYVLHDYADLFGNKIKSADEITNRTVEHITATFVNIYKALLEDLKFDKLCESMGAEMRAARKALRTNQYMVERCANTGDVKNAKAFEFLMNQNNKKIQRLEEAFALEKNVYYDKLEKMAEKEPKLEVWRDVIINHVENI